MDKWRQKLHIEPPREGGWMNDPNGLCFFGGKYHFYFQYSPDSPKGAGRKCWGHCESEDMFHWVYTGIVFYPDIPEDRSGVYSGCSVVNGDRIEIFYTGNVKQDGDFDYILEGREANQIHVTAEDPANPGEKKVILRNEDYPAECSCHVRDPKVWVEDGKWMMVLGARSRDDHGFVMLYEGDNPDEFKFVKKLQIPDFGFMWECPDMFTVSGKRYLGISPQGLEHEEYRYQNVYSSGYFKVDDNDNLSDFEEFDYGFDFYAPQTFVDNNGRRIIVGWMGIGDIPYTNPTTDLGWQHCLTLPRILNVAEDGGLTQNPVDEILKFRSEKKKSGDTINLPFDFTAGRFTEIKIGDAKITYDEAEGAVTLDLGGQYGRTTRKCRIGKPDDVRIVADMSSLEIYFNGGRYVMSTRFYPEGTAITVETDAAGADIFELKIGDTLIGIGEALIDFIPDKTGCDFSDVGAFSPKVGGAPANVCGAFSKLGGKSRMLTQLGGDPFGDKIEAYLKDAKIDTSGITRTDEANTALAFVSLDPDGGRTFSFYRKPSADMLMSPDKIKNETFEDAYALHFCSVSIGDFPMREAHVKAIECARGNDAIISFDPNLRFQLWDNSTELKTAVLNFMPEADILKISDEEIDFITGTDDLDEALPKLFVGEVKLVVYTCGADGAWAVNKEGKVFSPQIKVKAKDTTGAGDGFIGAFLYKLYEMGVTKDELSELPEDKLKEALDFSNKFCAISVTEEGAINSYPTSEEVNKINIERMEEK